ncbi:MAG: hypothetical protein ACKVHQ_09310, partial [Gammaproteobacteria bacterium]
HNYLINPGPKFHSDSGLIYFIQSINKYDTSVFFHEGVCQLGLSDYYNCDQIIIQLNDSAQTNDLDYKN